MYKLIYYKVNFVDSLLTIKYILYISLVLHIAVIVLPKRFVFDIYYYSDNMQLVMKFWKFEVSIILKEYHQNTQVNLTCNSILF